MSLDDKLGENKKTLKELLDEDKIKNPGSYNALKKLVNRMNDEQNNFIKTFAKEEFSDKKTFKRFIYDSEFREQYLDTQFVNTSGDKVYNHSINLFGDYTAARQWYFSKILALDYKRPYDYCKSDKKEIISNLLGAIEYGNIF